MLQIDKVQTVEGVQVYGDDKSFSTFYLLPEQPTFRVDDNGNPIFRFIEYRFTKVREDGRKGGGWAIFDVEFTVPDEKMAKIKETLQAQVNDTTNRLGLPPQQVKIGAITYTRGTSALNMTDENNILVEKI